MNLDGKAAIVTGAGTGASEWLKQGLGDGSEKLKASMEAKAPLLLSLPCSLPLPSSLASQSLSEIRRD